MKLFILVHGFNVKDGGAATVGRLEAFFSEYGKVVVFDYGYFGLWSVRFRNKKMALRLANMCQCAKNNGYGVTVVAHSNGCTIAHMAANIGAPMNKAVLINPALDKDAERPESMLRRDVWYSKHDTPVKIAKLLRKHPWGEMGAVGYIGDDPKTTNYNEESNIDHDIDHSSVFSYELLPYFGGLIAGTA